jgi:fructokinase
MRKIFGIGETVFDIIFKNGHPQAGKAGGSMLNSVVSIGRMGLPVYFISEFGVDDVGILIDSFLKENGVNTTYVNRYDDGNTTLAIAFLDEKNDASYTFYKNHHPGKLNVAYPDVKEGDILVCGSFYSIWSDIRERFKSFVNGAKERGALVIYDPNFRKSHLTNLQILKPLIIENMQMASLVRGSNEDFKNIFGVGDIYETYTVVKQFCPNLVYTANIEGVYVRTPHFSGKFQTKQITPVSTIGAGDNFNAGMITSIYKNNILPDRLDKLGQKEWSEVITTAVDFATDVCMSYENYISKEFASKIYPPASPDLRPGQALKGD